ncbi:hypothetical protein EVAR_94092_1 [Eumeta japonica]|uniref:Uncharacterized protein n=1 Tax=Eumeta variegata TaxID=151549 RepID=A0A4C1V5I0_EUMVA|nr:hypothetical protein EVAR_94092_1 [Eumeta japonica]
MLEICEGSTSNKKTSAGPPQHSHDLVTSPAPAAAGRPAPVVHGPFPLGNPRRRAYSCTPVSAGPAPAGGRFFEGGSLRIKDYGPFVPTSWPDFISPFVDGARARR